MSIITNKADVTAPSITPLYEEEYHITYDRESGINISSLSCVTISR
jgi:hypothetical protein